MFLSRSERAGRGERGAAGRAAVRCALGAVAGAVAMGTPCVSQASVNKHAFVVVFKHFFFEEILKRNGERQAKQYGLQREFKVGSAPSECKWIAT